MQQVRQGFIIPLLGILLVGAFIALSFFTTYKKTNETVGLMISEHVSHLGDVFTKIHKTCGILSFDYQKNPINFLNVKSFSGSQVGSMNLLHPKKWKGPYVHTNPTIQHSDFQVVRTHQGYFVAPGEGTKLPNGLTVGKDIILNETADIIKMAQQGGVLNYKGKSLTIAIPTQTQELSNVTMYDTDGF